MCGICMFINYSLGLIDIHRIITIIKDPVVSSYSHFIHLANLLLCKST